MKWDGRTESERQTERGKKSAAWGLFWCHTSTSRHHGNLASATTYEGRERGSEKEGESTMFWHVALELSSELKQQEGEKKDLFRIIERICWTINRLVDFFLNKKRKNCDLKGKTYAKLQQALTFVNANVMN